MLYFTYSSAWLLLIVPLAIGISAWYYYQTSPEISRNKRILLGTLRSLLLILLGILLLKPFLHKTSADEEKPAVVLLQDNSESILQTEDSLRLKNSYKKNFREFLQKFKNASVLPFLFDDKIVAYKDSLLRFDGKKTDISQAIARTFEDFEGSNLQEIFLITDGIYNQGINPVYLPETPNIPVHTVLLGDTNTYPDVFIEDVIYNKTAWLDTEIPVKIKVNSRNLQGKTFDVLLKSPTGKVLFRQKLRSREGMQSLSYELPVTREGFHHYLVEIPALPEEKNTANNLYHIYIKAVKNKLKVLLIAGQPHPDVGSISRAFQADKRFELIKEIRSKNKDFSIKPENINEAKAIIFYDFPGKVSDKKIVEKVLKKVKNGEAGLILFTGTQTDLRNFPELFEVLPLKTSAWSKAFTEARMFLTADAENLPVWNFSEEFRNWFEGTPPVLVNNSDWELNLNSRPVAFLKIKNIKTEYLAMALREQAGIRSFMGTMQNLWKLRLSNYLFDKHFEFYDNFLKNIVQWCSANSKQRRFFLTLSKRFYLGNEPVNFKATLKNKALQPVSDASVKLEIQNKQNKEKYIFFMNPEGKGLYSYSLASLPQGEYEVKAVATKGNRKIGETYERFNVGESNLESLDTRARADLLRQISARTGGKFFASLQEAEKYVQEKKYKTLLTYSEKEEPLFSYVPLLILLISLASAEWFLRRYWGLV